MDKKSEWIIKELKILEDQKRWDDCIELLKKNIKNNIDKKESYIFINYLLMNLLVEENKDINKQKLYENLALKYFKKSYKIFKNDAEFLFFTFITSIYSEFYFDLQFKSSYKNIFKKILIIEPNNFLYGIDGYNFLWKILHDNSLNIYEYYYIKKIEHIKKILKNNINITSNNNFYVNNFISTKDYFKKYLFLKGVAGRFVFKIINIFIKIIKNKKI